MIYKIEMQGNGQARVFDDTGRMMCQFAPYVGSFSAGQVDESAREVHMQHDNDSVGVYDLDSGTFKGWK